MSTKAHEEVNQVGGHTLQQKNTKKHAQQPFATWYLSFFPTESSDKNIRHPHRFFYTNLIEKFRDRQNSANIAVVTSPGGCFDMKKMLNLKMPLVGKKAKMV